MQRWGQVLSCLGIAKKPMLREDEQVVKWQEIKSERKVGRPESEAHVKIVELLRERCEAMEGLE